MGRRAWVRGSFAFLLSHATPRRQEVDSLTDLYVGVDLVCVRLEVSSGRSRRGGGELLLFGGEPFSLRSRRALLGLGGLTVSLEVADLGEIPSVACFATSPLSPCRG